MEHRRLRLENFITFFTEQYGLTPCYSVFYFNFAVRTKTNLDSIQDLNMEDNSINQSQPTTEDNHTPNRRKHSRLTVFKIVVTASFLVYVLFIGDNSLLRSCTLKAETERLQNEKTEYQNKIKETNNEIRQFQMDKSHIERLAREKYYMRKENEDVFIVK